ncbi:hypothetical protein HanRHA438_Chr10g0454821 [Helianthus annuus]|uniref:Uncharacterized protein n=1 Tax=Helianthus annuus TaxID=4232 RepID=A0A9K3HXM6_HELAN|nr:hypothetical protein HanXRQr2_Chr10g0442601 [Helianthus annuus]KAJ0530093.1 hypothetical protein HanHA89_Chr10g0385641 [Helianthus annuus]KAJ0696947.1 hypothetical protein HanLR1_Chr10g0363141 [Helianthus annuus]KAJ0879725.1 hypothetical protein HanRHA438_Chr10g0454821 [Helianthus annuus]
MANSSAAEKNDDGTGGQVNIVDEWLQELAALRSKIEKTLSDRLNLEPDNEDHRRLKRKYLEVLDVLPCLPDEGLETFEEGDMLNRTTGGSSSPPSTLAGGIEQPAQDDTDVASDSGDKYEEGNLNVLITGIAKTAEEGGDASLGDVSLVSDTLPGNKRRKKNKQTPPRIFYPFNLCLTKKLFFSFHIRDTWRCGWRRC